MHTMIVTMTLDPAHRDEVDRHFREQVSVWAKAQPGFVTGQWLRSDDGTKGLGVVSFASNPTATAAAAGPRTSPPAPAWSIDSVEIFEQITQN